jgi:hypothetical protein
MASIQGLHGLVCPLQLNTVLSACRAFCRSLLKGRFVMLACAGARQDAKKNPQLYKKVRGESAG